MFHLSQLNDDCLRQIIDYLELKDQLTLWQSTDSASRLSCILWNKWQQKTKHILSRETFRSNPELFKDFMLCICEKVEELHLYNIPTYLLEQCRGYSFYQMRKLDFEAYSFEDNDRDVEAFVFYLFASLRFLKLKGKRSGQHIEHLRHIHDLDLSECWQLEPQYFKRICSKLELTRLSIKWKEKQEKSYMEGILRLHKLQELQLNMFNLQRNQIEQILQLPKLCTLRFPIDGNRDPILIYTAELRGAHIHSIILNSSMPSCPIETWNHLKNLRDITFIGIHGKSIPWNFPHLEQLNVIDKSVWQSGRKFWHVVRDCPSLRVVNISRLNISEQFFDFDQALVDVILRVRDIPLRVNCHDVFGGCESLIRQRFRHNNLKVTFDKHKIETIDPFYCQLQFESNDIE